MMFFPKVAVRAVLLMIGGFFIFACAREPVIAKVNGEAITKKEMDVLLEHGGIKKGVKGSPEGGNLPPGIKEELLNQLINEKIILQAARKENIKIENKDVMNVYTSIVNAFPKEEDYLKKLNERGMSRDIVLRSIEKDLTIRKFRDSLSKDIVIPDNEVKDYYDKNPQAFTTTEQLRLSVIKANNLEEAKNIRKEIEKGANFDEMAKKYPAGHAGPGSGETGWVTMDTFPPEMAREINKIKAGAFGGPIKGKEGYYLISVKERNVKRVVPLGEVKENLKHFLAEQKKNEKFQSWLQEERKKAKIDISQKG